MLINESFKSFRIRSFHIEKELICHFLTLFIEMSKSGWFSLTIDEGVYAFTLEPSEPQILELSQITDDFSYPVQSCDELTHYIGEEILGIYDYRINGIDEGCIGVYFDCGDAGFSVLENDGCLSISDGISVNFQDEIDLVRINKLQITPKIF